MTDGQLLEAGMTTVANPLRPEAADEIDWVWYLEHLALMDYNAEAASKAAYNALRRERLNVHAQEKRFRP